MEQFCGIQGIKRKFICPVVTIGNFDGVHFGHLEIIKKLITKAKKLNGEAIVYSFRPHPRSVLQPEQPLDFISTYSERRDHLEMAGVDVFIEEPFSRAFSNIEPRKFFEKYLIEGIGTKNLMVGYDFGFGKNRSGDLGLLKKICVERNVELSVTSAQKEDGLVISSSEIRNALKNKKIQLATQLLGYPFYYRGNVVRGDQRGRKIGFPTANLKTVMKLTLPFGVYATQTKVGKKIFHSITNVGVRPTFKDTQIVIETHLIDQDIDLYGVEIKVEFLNFIRSEQKFPSIDLLKNQIAQDIEKVKILLP